MSSTYQIVGFFIKAAHEHHIGCCMSHVYSHNEQGISLFNFNKGFALFIKITSGLHTSKGHGPQEGFSSNANRASVFFEDLKNLPGR